MLAYILRRLLFLPVVIFGVSILIFSMLQMIDPYKRLSLYVHSKTKVRPGQYEELLHKYGLDRPIYEQYVDWMKGVFHGNLGYSESAHMSVAGAIGKYCPASAELALFAVFPLVFFGIQLGVFAASHQDHFGDHAVRIIAITGWSFPTFVFGLLMLLIFYGALPWFPPGRLSPWTIPLLRSAGFVQYTGMNTVDALLNGNISLFLDALRHLVLPVITLAYVEWALILRITRSSMLDTLRQDYITTARAKGLRERVVIHKHAKRNALIPVVTVVGWAVADLFGGVVIVETIFNYPGLGRFMAKAAIQLDIAAVLGSTMFIGVLMVVSNLVVDVLYAMVDPRVRLE